MADDKVPEKVDFASRPEVTVETMGKVHNPSGQGVKAVSSQVQNKKLKQINGANKNDHDKTQEKASHETTVKEGTAKRNISRKKTDGSATGNYDSRNKKQGGHGKGEWKEHLEPLDAEDQPPMDPNDPLWDDAVHGKYILSGGGGTEDGARGYDEAEGKAIYGPMLTLSEFKIQVANCVKEYFDSCDSDEVIRTLLELNCQEYHREIVKKAISLAMDKGPRERELTSRLLTSLHPTPMSDKDMGLGFMTLLDSLDDLRTDVPDANTMVASFLARAVVDEVLPPAFLSDQNNSRPGDPVVEKSVSLLSREHCNARLEKVWGPGDGRPVAELKQEMDQLLQEYLMSRELDEAARCVKELEAPHFHHELVKRGVKIAMELDGNAVNNLPASDQPHHELSNMDAMAALFGFLVRNAIISEYQVTKAVGRLHVLLPDLTLDVPGAPKLLKEFEQMAEEGGCLVKSKNKAAAAPTNGDAAAPKAVEAAAS
jgi:programmed cell death protein 4